MRFTEFIEIFFHVKPPALTVNVMLPLRAQTPGQLKADLPPKGG